MSGDVAPDQASGAFVWAELEPGDPDPEAGQLQIVEVCAARHPEEPYRCTRAAHGDEIHVASGLRGVVIATWRIREPHA